MGFCKESEKSLCKPFKCKAICSTGEVLREAAENFPRCGKICAWIERGINEINSCKDASCQIENTIVEFRNKKAAKGR